MVTLPFIFFFIFQRVLPRNELLPKVQWLPAISLFSFSWSPHQPPNRPLKLSVLGELSPESKDAYRAWFALYTNGKTILATSSPCPSASPVWWHLCVDTCVLDTGWLLHNSRCSLSMLSMSAHIGLPTCWTWHPIFVHIYISPYQIYMGEESKPAMMSRGPWLHFRRKLLE